MFQPKACLKCTSEFKFYRLGTSLEEVGDFYHWNKSKIISENDQNIFIYESNLVQSGIKGMHNFHLIAIFDK